MAVQDNTERLAAACLLSVAGGFLDIYTYLFRGRVFANAVTGNMVLFGYQLAEMQWLSSLKYLLAILSYAAGVFAAESLHNRLPKFANMIWHQLILLLEISCLLIVFFIRRERPDCLCLRHAGTDFPPGAWAAFCLDHVHGKSAQRHGSTVPWADLRRYGRCAESTALLRCHCLFHFRCGNRRHSAEKFRNDGSAAGAGVSADRVFPDHFAASAGSAPPFSETEEKSGKKANMNEI